MPRRILAGAGSANVSDSVRQLGPRHQGRCDFTSRSRKKKKGWGFLISMPMADGLGDIVEVVEGITFLRCSRHCPGAARCSNCM